MLWESSSVHVVVWAIRLSSGLKGGSWQNYWAVTTGSPRWNPWTVWERCSGKKSRRQTHLQWNRKKKEKGTWWQMWGGEREERCFHRRIGVIPRVVKSGLQPCGRPSFQNGINSINICSVTCSDHWRRSRKKKIWPSFVSSEENRWSNSERKIKWEQCGV